MLLNRVFSYFFLFFIGISNCVSADDLIGAGASFPFPLYSKMFYEYNKKNGIKVNYQSVGSGGGQRQIKNKTVDFGASDSFMTDNEMAGLKKELIHLPTCVGTVVVTYNLPNNPVISLSRQVLANIFLGKIKQWNHPLIFQDNHSVQLPDMPIIVVHRSDSSGTTDIFTRFLANANVEWNNSVGFGKSVKWKTGLGGKKNAGVAAYIKQIEGAIGYVDLAYTVLNNLPKAKIENKQGDFIEPSIYASSLSSNIDFGKDMRVALADSSVKGSYPIVGFTWLLVYKEQYYKDRSKEKAMRLFNLLTWMLNKGQSFLEDLYYVPLAENALKKARTMINSMTYKGEKLIKT